MVRVDPVADEAGEKAPVAPAGKPEMPKLTAPEKPLAATTETASVPLWPRATVTAEEVGVRLNEAPPVIVSEIVVLTVELPDVPVTVRG